jgi:tetratricopeptide (TPR) repeat protein
MKRIGLKTTNTGRIGSTLAAALLVVLGVMQPNRSMAQMSAPSSASPTQSNQPKDAPSGTASIHGKVLNAAGIPITKGEIRLTTDRSAAPADRKYPYTFPIDQNGQYTGTGIAPGNYVVIVFQNNQSVDFNESVSLSNKEDKLVDFDMSRPEYIAKMTPEEKKALEEYKKKNAEIVANNSKISNLNALLTQARADMKAGNYDPAVTGMLQATAAKPDEGILWITLADAQAGSADNAVKAAKAAGTPTNDPAIVQKYNDAVANYKKGIDLNAASKKPNAQVAATAYNQLGGAYAKLGDVKSASDAYESAAKTLPADAGMYYYNEAATMYNAGKLTEAQVAADKSIAADPKRADAYFIKGQALIPQATVDPKTQKITAPPGCVAAYQKYLELAPDGPHAADVKGILEGIGEQVKSTYKAPKK